jgi:hypothetical protein
MNPDDVPPPPNASNGDQDTSAGGQGGSSAGNQDNSGGSGQTSAGQELSDTLLLLGDVGVVVGVAPVFIIYGLLSRGRPPDHGNHGRAPASGVRG